MKKRVLVLLFSSTLSLFAQQEETGAIAHETGAAAMEAIDPTPSTWQNWVFAASALVTIAVGVTVIATNTGTFNH